MTLRYTLTRSVGRPVANRHKVPKAQWDKWSRAAQRTFNEMMHVMRPTLQWAFLAPGAPLASRHNWKVTQWNVAWAAAGIANE